jgi:hypothetical protein
MDVQRVTLAEMAEAISQCRSVGIFPTHLVGEPRVKLHAFKLTIGILIN